MPDVLLHGLAVNLLAGEAALPHRGDVVSQEAEVRLKGVEAGVAVALIRGVEAEAVALVVVVLVGGPGGAAGDDHGAGRL